MRRWPLVGRAEELRLLGKAIGGLASGGGVVIAGAAGVGKTRLAREVLAFEERGSATRWVAATTSSASIPLGAFAHLLPPPQHGERGQLALLHEASAALVRSSNGRRLVLGVDDAHLLDDLSATLVHHIAQTGAATLVVTVRSGEPTPDPIVALWKDLPLTRIDLQPLSKVESAELLAAVLDGQVDSVSLEALWRLTQGNALYLHELVEDAKGRGEFVVRGGLWSWQPTTDARPRLSDLIGSRLRDLDHDERMVLEYLAFAEPLELDVLGELVPSHAVLNAEREHLVVTEPVEGQWRVRLAHPLYGEVLRANTPSLAARGRRRSLAKALTGERLRGPADVLRHVTLALEADGTADAGLLRRAAADAAACLDYPLAERLARAAVDAGTADFSASLLLAYALAWQGRLEDLQAEHAKLAARASDDTERARAASILAMPLLWMLGEYERADELLASTSAGLVDGSAVRSVAGLRCVVAIHSGRPADALELGISAMRGSDVAGELQNWAGMWAGAGLTMTYGLLGKTEQALHVNQLGRDILATMGELSHFEVGLCETECTALRFGGRLVEAQLVAERLHDRAVTGANFLLAGSAAFFRGQVALARGLPATACRWLREALSYFGDFDPAEYRQQCHLGLAEAHSLRGEMPEAVAHLEALDAITPTLLPMHAANELLIRAWVACGHGELSRAGELAMSAARTAADMGLPAVEAVALHTALRFDHTEPVAARLGALAKGTDSALVAACAAHAAALERGDGGALDAAAAAFRDMGAGLLAVDASVHASVAHEAAGRHASALAAAARARAGRQDCEGACTPAALQLAQPVVLTRREREIAGLAARGVSNREIAERLVISVRTVESHIAKVYTKLGVNSRDALADATGVRTQ